MGTLYVDTLEPEGGTTTLTVGETGQNTVAGGNTIKLNTLKDAGGNTIFTSDGSGNLSSVNSAFGSAQVLLSTQTITGSDTQYVDFTSAITGAFSATYMMYIFRFYRIHPTVSNKYLDVIWSKNAGTDFDQIENTNTVYTSYHTEGGSSNITYQAGWNVTDSVARVRMSNGAGTTSTMSIDGELKIYNPSNTSLYKYWTSTTETFEQGNAAYWTRVGGLAKTTSAVNGVRFQISANAMDSGVFQMWGVK